MEPQTDTTNERRFVRNSCGHRLNWHGAACQGRSFARSVSDRIACDRARPPRAGGGEVPTRIGPMPTKPTATARKAARKPKAAAAAEPAAAPRQAARRGGPRTAEEILERLNPPQREAVQHPSGPLLILAGAGQWQDAGAGASGRLPGRHRGQALADRGRHLHQQGGQRDARADRGADRGGRRRARPPSAPSMPSAPASCGATATRWVSAAASTSTTAPTRWRWSRGCSRPSTWTTSASRRPGCWPGSGSARTSWPMSRPPPGRRPTSTTRPPPGCTPPTSASCRRTTRSTSTTC